MTQAKTWKERRDSLCREYMHSYKGTASENNQDAFSGFMAGYTAGRSDLMKDVEGLVSAFRNLTINVPYNVIEPAYLTRAKEALSKFEEDVK